MSRPSRCSCAAGSAAWSATSRRGGTRVEPSYLAAARALTEAARASLFPTEAGFIVADPFCGGGSNPTRSFANRGARLCLQSEPGRDADQRGHAERTAAPRHAAHRSRTGRGHGHQRAIARTIGPHYASESGEAALAWIYFRTARCEGPDCGATIPLTSKLALDARTRSLHHSRHRRFDGPTPHFEVRPGRANTGTVRRGSATCLKCGATLPVERSEHN